MKGLVEAFTRLLRAVIGLSTVTLEELGHHHRDSRQDTDSPCMS
jgi:hypothetical protein